MENLIPPFENQIGRGDDRAGVITAGQQVEQDLVAVLVERDIARSSR
jgi:hypothetical protein